MSEAAKEPYMKMAADDKMRYDTAMATYEPSEAYTAAQQAFKAKVKGEAGGSGNDEDAEANDKRKEAMNAR